VRHTASKRNRPILRNSEGWSKCAVSPSNACEHGRVWVARKGSLEQVLLGVLNYLLQNGDRLRLRSSGLVQRFGRLLHARPGSDLLEDGI
jgi:hypothetical protein